MNGPRGILGHALDGLRSVSAGVLANELTTFLRAIAASGWAAAVAAIDPTMAAGVISVAVALNFVRGRTSNITKEQAERLILELGALSKSQDSAIALAKELASKTAGQFGTTQLAATIDAVLGRRFDEIDDRLAGDVQDHLKAASEERAEIRSVLDELYLTVRLYLDQVDSDLQTLKTRQEIILEGQQALAGKFDQFVDALGGDSTEKPGQALAPDTTAHVAAQVLAVLLEQIQSRSSTEGGLALQQVDLRAVAATVALDPPPLVTTLCERQSAVAHIQQALNETTWLAIRGDSGTGKTQLAALVTRRHGGATLWVRLRDLDSKQAAVSLDVCMRSLLGEHAPERVNDRIRELCAILADRTLVVLDDVPRFDSEDALGQRLLLLASGLSDRHLQLLSTSAHALPTKLTEGISSGARTVECPEFTDAEVAELFLAHGAPATTIEPQRIKFIRTITRSHPLLLVAAARYLKQRQWQFSDSDIDALLRGQHAALIAGDTLDRLIATVSDEDARDLLYRLKLVAGEFTSDDATAVASVDPAIARPTERLHLLTGLWVQRESEDRYSLSPLIRALPDANLTETTRRSVHLALGSRIVQRRVLDPWDLIGAISHFHGAEYHNYSAMLLLQGLRTLIEKGEVGDATVLLLMWASTPIPCEVAPSLQVFVRAHQVQARVQFGLPVDYAMADLRRLVSALPGDEGWALISIVAVAGRTVSALDPLFANQVFLRVVNSWRRWRGPNGQSLPLPEGLDPEALLWMAVEGLKTWEHIRDWMSTVWGLSAASRELLFLDAVAEDLCIILADRLWVEEHRKPASERDWDAVLLALDELHAAADELKQPYLASCVVRSKVVVFAEYKDDLDGAVALGEAALANESDDPRAEFLIRECVARQYVFKQRFEEARQWFATAFATNAEGPRLQIAFAFAHAARVFGELCAGDGLRYAEQAVRVSRDVPNLVENARVQLLGELAIATWLSGGLPGAFDALDEAADYLISSQGRDDYWKGLFMCFGHTCGYFASVARTGRPPAVARDGGPWAAPERGFFLRDHERAATLYADQQSPGVFVHLVLLAEGVGNDVGADKWAARGLEAAREARLPAVTGVFADLSIAGHICRRQYAEALDLGIEAARCTFASQLESAGDRPSPWITCDVDAVLRDVGAPTHMQAEKHAAMSGLLPTALHLGTAILAVETDVVDRVGKLVQHIRAKMSSSASPDFWDSVISVLDQVFVQRSRSDDLVQFGNQQDDWLVRNLAYLGATLHPDVSLTTAIIGHLAVLSSSATLLEVVVGTERRIALPFIEEYWRGAFQRECFRFSAPSEVERRLQGASSVPIAERTRAILRAVVTGLGVRVPDYARSWLFEENQ